MVRRIVVCVVEDHSDGGVGVTIVGFVGDVSVEAVPER